MKIDDKALDRWWTDLLSLNPRLRLLFVVERLESAGEQGWDRAKFLQMLHRVWRSRTEEWHQASRKDLRDLIDLAALTSRGLNFLKSSEVARKVFPSMDNLRLVCQLLDNAVKNGSRILPSLQKKHTPRTDEAIANVVLYVEENAGKPYDREVGALLKAILGKTMRMKRWRQLHVSALNAARRSP